MDIEKKTLEDACEALLRFRRSYPDLWAKEIAHAVVKSTEHGGVFIILHDPLTDPVLTEEIVQQNPFLKWLYRDGNNLKNTS